MSSFSPWLRTTMTPLFSPSALDTITTRQQWERVENCNATAITSKRRDDSHIMAPKRRRSNRTTKVTNNKTPLQPCYFSSKEGILSINNQGKRPKIKRVTAINSHQKANLGGTRRRRSNRTTKVTNIKTPLQPCYFSSKLDDNRPKNQRNRAKIERIRAINRTIAHCGAKKHARSKIQNSGSKSNLMWIVASESDCPCRVGRNTHLEQLETIEIDENMVFAGPSPWCGAMFLALSDENVKRHVSARVQNDRSSSPWDFAALAPFVVLWGHNIGFSAWPSPGACSYWCYGREIDLKSDMYALLFDSNRTSTMRRLM